MSARDGSSQKKMPGTFAGLFFKARYCDPAAMIETTALARA
jgi:hypothetical protein